MAKNVRALGQLPCLRVGLEDGWTLTLNPGWVLRPDPSRVGSYISVKVPAT